MKENGEKATNHKGGGQSSAPTIARILADGTSVSTMGGGESNEPGDATIEGGKSKGGEAKTNEGGNIGGENEDAMDEDDILIEDANPLAQAKQGAMSS